MKWKNYFILISVMFAIGLFFHYLNSKPGAMMRAVIMDIRRVGGADSREDALALQVARTQLNKNQLRLKAYLSERPSEAELITIQFLDHLISEDVTTLENAPERPLDKDDGVSFKKLCKYVNVTHELRNVVIEEWSQQLNTNTFHSIAAKYDERAKRAVSRLANGGGPYRIKVIE